jgi:hypothetical protein
MVMVFRHASRNAISTPQITSRRISTQATVEPATFIEEERGRRGTTSAIIATPYTG